MRLWTALFCLALLQAVQPPRDATPAAQKTGTSVIKGRVLAGNTDTGVASATVYIVMFDRTNPVPRGVLTDRSGRFSIGKLPAGSYRLSVLPPQNNGRFLSTDTSRPIDVEDGATVTAPDMRLARAAAVSGRIVDERGDPLANVEVYAMGQRPGIPTRQRMGQPFGSRTDDQGRFRLFGLPAGEIIVAADASSGGMGIQGVDQAAGFVSTYYPDAVSEAEARRVTLREGADIDGIDIVMTRMRTFHLRGTVVNSRGLPSAGAGLGLHHSANGSGSTSSVTVAPDGTFDVPGVLPGSYRLIVGPFDPRSFRPFGGTRSTEYASVPVEVIDSNVDDITVATRPSVDLIVGVAFESEAASPLPAPFGLIGWPAQDMGIPPSQAELTADSTVVLKGTAGPIVLRPMFASAQAEWFLKGVYLGTRDITDTATEFTSADAERVRLVLTSRAAAVTGTVTDDAGKPARDYGVVLFPEDRAEWIDHSSGTLTGSREKDGTYKVSGVRPGRYRITAIERERINRLYFDRVSLLESLLKDSVAITVTENEQRVVDLKLVKAGGQ
jgi:carboxypeptidase family protein